MRQVGLARRWRSPARIWRQQQEPHPLFHIPELQAQEGMLHSLQLVLFGFRSLLHTSEKLLPVQGAGCSQHTAIMVPTYRHFLDHTKRQRS